jgi:hypothetical protein
VGSSIDHHLAARDGEVVDQLVCDPSSPRLGTLCDMIISHRFRYVFVEVPRTGSTAVSEELREHYDGNVVLRKHASYRDFLRVASDDERRYFTFSGVRNPLDVAVTRYVRLKDDVQQVYRDPRQVAYRNSISSRIERRIHAWVQRTDADFESFLRRWYLLPYDTWTTLDHKRMNAILRFESLAVDFEATLRQMGITPVGDLPVRNVTPGRDREWASYYTPRAIQRAVWVFGPYMEHWGYAFPASWGVAGVPMWSHGLFRVAHVLRSIYWKYFRFADYVQRQPGGAIAIPRDH